MKPATLFLILTVTLFSIEMKGITVSTNANPSGDPLYKVDGVSFNFGQNFTWASGSTHYLVAWDQISSLNPQTQNFVFNYWLVNGFSHNTNYSITVNPTSNSSYIAYYTRQYRIFISSTPSSGGTTTPVTDCWVNSGGSQVIKAVPNCGYYFDHWTINGTTVYQNPCTITNVTSSYDVYAVFTALPAQTWSWVQLPSMSVQRPYAQAVGMNGEIYCMGGYYGSTFHASVEKFNGLNWEAAPSMAQARAQFASCAINNTIYVFGGQNSSILQTSEVYNGTSWSQSISLPVPITDANGEYYNGSFYLFGGITSFTPTYQYDDKVRKFTPGTGWTVLSTIPFPRRAGYSTVLLNNMIYFIGGAYAPNGSDTPYYYNKIYRFNPVTVAWDTLAPMCRGRADFNAEVIDGKIYVIGGINPDQYPEQFMEVYDPISNGWTEVNDAANLSASCTSSVVMNGILYLLGVNGNQVWNQSKPLTVFVNLEGLYDPLTNSMIAVNDGTGPRWGSGVADKITIELHNSSTYGTTEYSNSDAFLSTGGQAVIYVPVSKNGSYYLTVKNRNHIETTSASPIPFSGNSITYSFDALNKAYGNNLKQLENGQYAIFAGDVDQDDFVDSGDMTLLDNQSTSFLTGYLPEDVNGDGFVDTADMVFVDNNAANFTSALHP